MDAGMDTFIFLTIKNSGVTEREARRLAHIAYHEAYGFSFSDEDKDLDCEICSGVPPWEWKDYRCHVECFPDEWHHDYSVKVLAFGWRVSRDWNNIPFPMGICRECGKFSRIARHKFTFKSHYRENHICLKCVRKENRQETTKDQAKEVKRLIRELKKGART